MAEVAAYAASAEAARTAAETAQSNAEAAAQEAATATSTALEYANNAAASATAANSSSQEAAGYAAAMQECEPYDASKTYAIANMVTSGGSTYRCIKPCTGIQPPNDEYWLLIAEAGADGCSPTVTVTKSGKVATITATDKNGTTTAEIRDGADGSGSGDMSKTTYDANNDGIVDDAAKLGGQAPDYYAKAADIANKQDALVSGTNIKTINNKPLLGAGNLEIKLSDLSGDSTHRLVTDAEKEAWGNKLDSESDPTVPDWAKAETKPAYTASEVGAIPASDKGAAGGVASLGTDGKVPKSQLPAIGTGDMTAAVYDPAGGAKQVAFADELSGRQAKITASGILKGDGSGGISAAEAGTDYVAPSALSDYIPASQKGVATGVATLNGNALVTPSQLFSGMVSANASKTLTADDFGTLQEVKTPSAITITLPTGANTVIGAEVQILLNRDSGEVTIAPPTDVMLNGVIEPKVMSEAYGIAVLKCVAKNKWIIKGDIS